MSYARKLVVDLALLCLQLDTVGEQLPTTPATKSKMLAERLKTVLGRLYQADNASFKIILLLYGYPYIDHIAGNGIFDENDLPFVGMSHTFAFSGNALDGQVLNDDFLL